MRRSVLHRHLRLDPGEELVEAHPEVGEEDDEGRDRRHRPAALDGAHEGAGERRADRGLAEMGRTAPSSELVSDGGGQGSVGVLQNS